MMNMTRAFLFALGVSAAGMGSAAALTCNNKHPELCRKADLAAEIETYGTINAAGQFTVKQGVALSTQTHFINLANNSPLTVSQLVMMIKMGSISADGTFNGSSPLNIGFTAAPSLIAAATPSLPPVGSPMGTTGGTASSELAKLGTFDANGGFHLNPGVAANQRTNFVAINPVDGSKSQLNVAKVQLMIRLGAIKPDGSFDPGAVASTIVYQAPAPSVQPGAAVINPTRVSASSFDNMRPGQPGAALAAAQLKGMGLDGAHRQPQNPSALTNFYHLRVTSEGEVYGQATQREVAEALAGGLIRPDGTLVQDPGNGWGSAADSNQNSLPVLVFLPTPPAPGPGLTPSPRPGANPAPMALQAPPIAPQLIPKPMKAHKWSSTTVDKPVPNTGAPAPQNARTDRHRDPIEQKRALPQAASAAVPEDDRVVSGKRSRSDHTSVLQAHFANSRVQKPSDCITSAHGRQGAGGMSHCLLPNNVVTECLSSGQRRRVARGPDGTLNGIGMTESFRSVDEDVNSAPANHFLSSSCIISIQRRHL